MKTIEINLIGDLKQKAAPSKISAFPQSLTQKTTTPQEARNILIVYGVGSLGALLLIISALVALILFIWGFFLDSSIKNLDKKITLKTEELAKSTKYKDSLIVYRKDLYYKKSVKNLIEQERFQLGQILEELRVKIPESLTLQKVTKGPKGTIIQGVVTADPKNALDYITYFITNINTMKQDVSIVRNAIISTVSNKKGQIGFSIKADVVNKPPEKQENLLLTTEKEQRGK